LADFCGDIGELVSSLDEILTDHEVEAMDTPEANVLGTLECLLADDLKPALRKLRELGSLFK
jgi:hypothetical protein